MLSAKIASSRECCASLARLLVNLRFTIKFCFTKLAASQFLLAHFFTILLKDYFFVFFYLFHLGRKRLVVKKKRNGKGIVKLCIFSRVSKKLFLCDFLAISLLGERWMVNFVNWRNRLFFRRNFGKYCFVGFFSNM